MREEHADCRRPRRLTGGQRLARLGQVEVEARHRRRLVALPGTLRHADHGQARWRHPALLRAGGDDVEAPSVGVEGHRTQAADAVDQEQRVRRGLAHRRRDVAQRILDAGRCLVVGQQDRPWPACRCRPSRAAAGRPGPGRPRGPTRRRSWSHPRRRSWRSWRSDRRTSRSRRPGRDHRATGS